MVSMGNMEVIAMVNRKYNSIFLAVNFNNANVTFDYIKNCSRFGAAIVIIDNGSFEEDYLKLLNYSKDYPDVFLVKSKTNIGYFKGLNLGLEYIQNNNLISDFVIIGNNDLEFEEDFIQKLSEKSIKNDVLAIVPDVCTIDGIHQNPHVINRISKLRKLFFDVYYLNYYVGTVIRKLYLTFKKEKKYEFFDDEITVYMGIGAIYILTVNFFEKFTKLDAQVFLWGEEALFANQIASVEGKILYCPDLKVTHLESMSTKKISSKDKYKQMQESYKIFKKYL